MCPTCHGEGVVRTATEASMVPDPSLSIRDGAIGPWPGAWLGKNFRDILDTLGVDVDAPWRDLPKDTRDWILWTDERPVVTVVPERDAERRQGEYQGRWQSVEKYLRHTLTSKSDKQRARALSYMSSEVCPTCDGRRLNPDALRVTYLGEPIDMLMHRTIGDLYELLVERAAAISPERFTGAVTPELEAERLLLPGVVDVLAGVSGLGLGHLALDRGARTLSSGELQRLRLAGQVRSGLFGVAYVLDEPSTGLHPSEKGALVKLLHRLVAEGNSVLMVEHDMSLVAEADWIVDVGPGAGADGGEVLYSGPRSGLADVENSVTARYIDAPRVAPKGSDQARHAESELELTGVTMRAMHGEDVTVPLGTFTAVAGVSGAGKTTLLDVIAQVMEGRVTPTSLDEDTGEHAHNDGPARVESVTGADGVERLVRITQKPIGRSPRSCVATYTGMFDRIRRLFADTDEAKARGWKVGRFSFNVAEGRCPTCDGEGQVEVELVFLPGAYATCPTCHGKRYNAETLQVRWGGMTIADVLGLSVRDALTAFASEPGVLRSLRALDAIGLGYLTLGQPATELSGGEAQRIKLATELQRTGGGRTLYLLDEPTSGLHPADVDLLVTDLNRLVDGNNTVIAQADHVIELGPGAGDKGGKVVAAGTPAHVAATDTATGRCLRG